MSAIVFYDPATGEIYQSGQMPAAAAEAVGWPFIVVDHYDTGIDSQFRVENGALVPIAPPATPA